MTSFSMLVGNDRIELIAIAEFAGLCLAIDVEWFVSAVSVPPSIEGVERGMIDL
jgi:hypothetical protein